jgi:hypothetical protein
MFFALNLLVCFLMLFLFVWLVGFLRQDLARYGVQCWVGPEITRVDN